jgi:DNA repair protein RecO (recombination protein O)
MSVTFNTKALILKTIAYGETSIIVTALTELFGVQSYIVKGVRKGTKKQAPKVSFFQPAALLDMIVYHHPINQLNFVKEYKWATLYQHIYSNVTKNAIALYIVELLQKCLKEPDTNPELLHFTEDVLLHLDAANADSTANVALFFAIHLPNVLGLQLYNNYSASNTILDLKDGVFTNEPPIHNNTISAPLSTYISDCSKALQPAELEQLHLNGAIRKNILDAMELFYQLHISEFGKIKTLPILHQILG